MSEADLEWLTNQDYFAGLKQMRAQRHFVRVTRGKSVNKDAKKLGQEGEGLDVRHLSKAVANALGRSHLVVDHRRGQLRHHSRGGKPRGEF